MKKKVVSGIVIMVLVGVAIVLTSSPSTMEKSGGGKTTKAVPTVVPSPSPSPSPSATIPPPFISQAPLAQWENPVFQDACEEASIVMAHQWYAKQSPITAEQQTQTIQQLADYQISKSGSSVDTSAVDTARLLEEYFGVKSTIIPNATVQDIKSAVQQNNLVIAPTNGQALKNPYFTPPGPERHMLVIFDYDNKANEFITNDPGTKHGAGFRYQEDILFSAIRDYPSGDHAPIESIEKNIIVVGD